MVIFDSIIRMGPSSSKGLRFSEEDSILSSSTRMTCKLTGYTNMKSLKGLKGHMHRLMVGFKNRLLMIGNS